MSCSMKTLIATCSASYANVPLVSPVCPSNDNYVPTPMLVAFSTEIRKKVIYKTNLALQALAESYTEHMKHTQAKSHNSKRLQSDRRENTQQSSRGAKRWHCLEVHCLYHSLPLAVIFYR